MANMSSGPDFGLLQPQGHPAQTQVINAANPAAENEKGLLAGLSSLQEAQRTNLLKQSTNAEIADKQARLGMAQEQLGMEKELQPGRLGLQNAQIEEAKSSTAMHRMMTQGQAIENQNKQLDLKGKELDWSQRQELIKTAPQGLQAHVQTLQQQGKFADAALVMKGYGDARQAAADAGTAELKEQTGKMSTLASNMHSLMSLPPQDQVMTFRAQAPLLKRLDPEIGSYINLKDPTPEQIQNYGAISMGAALSLQAQQTAKATPEKMQLAGRIGELEAKPNKTPAETAELQSLRQQTSSTQSSDTAAIEKTVNYISELKQQVQTLPPGSPEAKAAQDKLDFALSQAKQDNSLWSKIKDKVADSIGSTVGGIINKTVPQTQPVSKTLNGQTYHFINGKWMQ